MKVLLKDYGLSKCNPSPTLGEPAHMLYIEDGEPDTTVDVTKFVSLLDAIRYLAGQSRPDMALPA